MNVMHSSMKITDEFYSNLNEDEVQKRINSLGKDKDVAISDSEMVRLFQEFVRWKATTQKWIGMVRTGLEVRIFV